MDTAPSLHQRRRSPTAQELANIPWLALLLPADRQRAVDDLMVGEARPGDLVCRVGRPVTYWFGVVSGLLKMSSDNEQGHTMTFTGVNSISSTLQLTGTGVAATRTMAMTNVNDRLTISGNVTQGVSNGAIVAGNATQTALGTLSGNPTVGGAANYTPAGTNTPGAATSVVQPYIVVYMWKRTA